MNKKLWFYLFWIQFGIVTIALVISVYYQLSLPIVYENDVSGFVEEGLAYEDQYGKAVPEDGYIPDADTAAKVGCAIIDAYMSDRNKGIHFSTVVEHDPENRLWKVRKSYFPNYGGDVVLNQDTGEVVYIVLYK